MSLPTSPRAIPPRLGPYRITGELGRGGMGVVYRGQHEELGVERALKLLDRLDPKSLARFEREVSHLAQIRHPNVVGIHDVGVDDGRPWFAMSLVEGHPLDELLRGARLPLQTALALAVGIADGVAALHQDGVVHRDLKPANVVVTAEGQPVVLDLGLAVAPDRDQRLTKTGTTLGTVSYMAPEQFHGAERATTATDVFALGLIVFELTTGEAAVSSGSTQEIAAAILTEDRPLPTHLDPDLPALLDRLCRRATQRDPAQRHADAGALAAALRALIASPGPSRRAVRRRAAIGVGLIGLAAAAALAAFGRGPAAPSAPTDVAAQGPTAPTATPAPAPTQRALRSPGRPWRKLRHPRCRGAAFLDDVRLVTWGEDRSVRVWDLETERVLHRWSAPSMIVAGAVSSDGRVAFADLRGVYATSADLGDPKTLHTFAGPFLPRTLVFSPSGTQLALGGKGDRGVRILDVGGGRLLRRIGDHAAKLDQVVFAQDGARLATACGESMEKLKNQVRDHAVRVFDTASGALKHKFDFVGQANAVAWRPGAEQLAVCADGQAVILIDLSRGARTQLRGKGASKKTLFIAAHRGVTRELTYTPDGRYLLSVSDGPTQAQNELRVWDPDDGAEIAAVTDMAIDEASVGSLATSPSGRDVVVSHAKGAWVYDVRGLISLRTSPDGRR